MCVSDCTFWSQLKPIHENATINKLEDKFQDLIQATLPGTRAREFLKATAKL